MLWKLRAIFYGGGAIVAALVLTAGGGEAGPVFLDGRTSQGRGFTMELEDGRPTALGTNLVGICQDGEEWPARWWSFDGRTTRFRFDDGRLAVREQVTHTAWNGQVNERNFTLEARIADGRVTGTMRLVENVTWRDELSVCKSGDVTFSARAG